MRIEGKEKLTLKKANESQDSSRQKNFTIHRKNFWDIEFFVSFRNADYGLDGIESVLRAINGTFSAGATGPLLVGIQKAGQQAPAFETSRSAGGGGGRVPPPPAPRGGP